MNFTRNATSQLLAQAAVTGLQFGAGVALARLLTVADRGVYGLVVSFAMLITMFAHCGWSMAVIYRIRREERPPGAVFAAVVTGLAMTGALAVGLALLFQEPLRAKFLPGEGWIPFAIALVFVPIALFARALSAVARAVDEFDLQNIVRVLVSVVFPIALTLVLLLTGGSLVAALLTLLVIRLLGVVGIASRLLPITGFGPVDRSEIRAGFRFGARNAAIGWAGQLHEKADAFMLVAIIGGVAGKSLVGVYLVAVAVAQLPRTASEAVAAALAPKLAGLPDREAAEYAAKVCRHTVLLVGGIAGLMMLVGPLLIPLVYGAPFEASITPFLLLAPAIVPLSIYRMLARYFLAFDRQGLPFVAQVIAVAVNVGLNLWLIPTHGLAGVAIASLASYSIAAIIVLFAFRHSAGLGWRDILVLRRDDLDFYRRGLTRLRARLGGG